MTEVAHASPSGPKARYRADVSMAGGNAATNTASPTVLTCTVNGARVTDLVIMNTNLALPAGVLIGCPWVSTTNVVTFYVVNPTAAAVALGTLALGFEILTSPVTVS